MTKIKPCPFCGRKPRMWDEEDAYYPGGPVVIGHYLKCKCGARMDSTELNEEKLIKEWNKRKNLK